MYFLPQYSDMWQGSHMIYIYVVSLGRRKSFNHLSFNTAALYFSLMVDIKFIWYHNDFIWTSYLNNLSTSLMLKLEGNCGKTISCHVQNQFVFTSMIQQHISSAKAQALTSFYGLAVVFLQRIRANNTRGGSQYPCIHSPVVQVSGYKDPSNTITTRIQSLEMGIPGRHLLRHEAQRFVLQIGYQCF